MNLECESFDYDKTTKLFCDNKNKESIKNNKKLKTTKIMPINNNLSKNFDLKN